MVNETWEGGADETSDGSAAPRKPDGGTGSEHFKEELNSAFDTAKSKAAEMAGPFKDKARELAQNQKDAVAGQLHGLAEAIESSADKLSQDSPNAAGILRVAASSMESVSGSLQKAHIDEITRSIGHFARTRPGSLFAGAAIIGFAASRFLKSSNAPQRNT